MRRAQVTGLLFNLRCQSHRQVVDSLRKGSDLSDGALGVVHLPYDTNTTRQGFTQQFNQAEETSDSPHLLQVVLIELDAPLEAAAFGHFDVQRADELLAVILTFPPEGAEAPERQTSGLEGGKSWKVINQSSDVSVPELKGPQISDFKHHQHA